MGNEKDHMKPKEPDSDTYMQQLAVTGPLMEAPIRSALQALQLPLGSRGLDAGCGIGLQIPLLAEAVGTAGHVTGLDISPEFLSRAMEIAQEAGILDRIAFQEGDVKRLPFDDNTFDWAWSANCVGYGLVRPDPSLSELARVVKPGGSVAVLIWSSEHLLPGYPRLEARLRATSSGIAPFTEDRKPEFHFLRSLGWFREVGLKEPAAQTFAGSAYAPLSDDIRRALSALIDMRWPDIQPELTPKDWEEYQRLCLPESPDYILNLPDYYAFFTYSMFHGKAVE
ncbi:class I SAM-dependent methyltransferase [Chloroflexota bacterium]